MVEHRDIHSTAPLHGNFDEFHPGTMLPHIRINVALPVHSTPKSSKV